MGWKKKKNLNILSSPGMRERAVNTSSVSKCYGMGGWRAGYVVAHQDFIRNIAKLHLLINNGGPPTFVQYGASALYEDVESEPLKDLLKACEKRIGLQKDKWHAEYHLPQT